MKLQYLPLIYNQALNRVFWLFSIHYTLVIAVFGELWLEILILKLLTYATSAYTKDHF